jgi:hypothetical protein
MPLHALLLRRCSTKTTAELDPLPETRMITARDVVNAELILLGAYVVFLLLMPKFTVKIFGLTEDPSTFWPRVVGAGAGGVLLGVIAQDQGWTKTGIGIGGCVALNLTMAIILALMMLVGPKMPTSRGNMTVWGIAVIHAVFGFVQIAFA